MEIRRIYHDTAAEGQGVVVVIDVIRAFSVAAYAFAGGARELWLVRHVEEALALRQREPTALLAGEVNGRKIAGFDFSNSPAEMAKAAVEGRLIIQRTGSGTRGAVSAVNAGQLLVSGLVNARGTASLASKLAAENGELICLYPTATIPDESDTPNEDDYCADYIAALLRGAPDATGVLESQMQQLKEQGRFQLFHRGYPDCPVEDVPAFLAVDRFAFAMVGSRARWEGIEYVRVHRVNDGTMPTRYPES
jgi:2-phosphosulfolactate phosphatase